MSTISTVSTNTTTGTEISTDTSTMLTCLSCGMPIESGEYCDHCTDETGALQSFDDRFSRMTQWQLRANPGETQQEAERATLQYLATMPAWRDHPRVVARE
ncbi:zinc ribbon domain-containing protein [Subtercola frigoramans]|uniref:Zinc ribbon domain-containing protein n=1 Tax=Subtercola frigoramans TaxID=120298 RepID=A0ABS2L7M6_9MICO|nr:hypothetical protein [Subtercola frigoramans]MBM7472984.1 hypothetical protein [Subtercola frigoramans]